MIKEAETEIEKLRRQLACPVELSLRVLGGKWRGSILYQLKDGPLRFNELRNKVQDAVWENDKGDNYLSNKVLIGHLNFLIEAGLVLKTNEHAPATYKLTGKGETAMPILIDLFYWGKNNF